MRQVQCTNYVLCLGRVQVTHVTECLGYGFGGGGVGGGGR